MFPLCTIVNVFRSQKIPKSWQIIMWFSGLRGIISFVLALNIPGSARDDLVACTVLVVLVSILIFGGGALPLVHSLGETRSWLLSDTVSSYGVRPVVPRGC